MTNMDVSNPMPKKKMTKYKVNNTNVQTMLIVPVTFANTQIEESQLLD